MQRFVIVLLSVLILMPFAGQAAAFQNEPPGFRGIDWGADIATLKAKGLNLRQVSDQEGMKNYVLRSDSLALGEAELQRVTYSFYKDRFFRVLIDYKDIWNYEDLEKLLTGTYGPGRPAPGAYKTLWWHGKKVSVGLAYGIIRRTGTLSLIYLPIQSERERDQAEAISGGIGPMESEIK